jgi:uncharacterized protein YwgA
LPVNLDIVLLISVFGAHQGNRIEGRTRIQKEICLLRYGSNLPFTFDFKPYFYGPYSEELSETINTLVGVRLLKETIIPVSFNSFRYDYTLTEQGRRLFDRYRNDFAGLISRISEEVRRLEAIETPALVAFAKEISGIESAP